MLVNEKFINIGFDDCIKTEELIFSQLKSKASDLSDEFELFTFSLAVLINKFGVDGANSFISRCESQKRRIFVCQHIWAEKLIFSDSDLVFTPHSMIGDRFISIPHQAVNFDTSLRNNKRTYQFSFTGNLGAHQSRKRLSELFPENVTDSGVGWGLDIHTPYEAKRRYINLLAESFFSLCPRGTGISSVRLFESLAMGSIPVIIADNYSAPLENFIDWSQFSIRVEESSVDKIPEILSEISKDAERLETMRTSAIETYEAYFSNQNLAKTIEITLSQHV